MYLEIISPKATLYTGEVECLTVPGTNGSFQVLENHAAIVSTLISGKILIKGSFGSKEYQIPFNKIDTNLLTLEITSGVLEMQNNKLILLVD